MVLQLQRGAQDTVAPLTPQSVVRRTWQQEHVRPRTSPSTVRLISIQTGGMTWPEQTQGPMPRCSHPIAAAAIHMPVGHQLATTTSHPKHFDRYSKILYNRNHLYPRPTLSAIRNDLHMYGAVATVHMGPSIPRQVMGCHLPLERLARTYPGRSSAVAGLCGVQQHVHHLTKGKNRLRNGHGRFQSPPSVDPLGNM